MAYVLQVDFKMNGPFGDEMAEDFSDLAKSINEELMPFSFFCYESTFPLFSDS